MRNFIYLTFFIIWCFKEKNLCKGSWDIRIQILYQLLPKRQLFRKFFSGFTFASIMLHALRDQLLPIGQEFEISVVKFSRHFTSLTTLLHCMFWPISGLYIVTCLSHLPSETVHRAPCRTKNYKSCIMFHSYLILIVRIHYGHILNRQFIKNIENSYATI